MTWSADGRLDEFKECFGVRKTALNPFGAVPCIHHGELFTRYAETILETVSRPIIREVPFARSRTTC